jgi:hypothetical protein
MDQIEHRLFSFITINWRGKPLRSFRTIVQLIAATTTDTGFKVRAEIDTRKYPRGVKISDAETTALNSPATHFMATGTTRSHLAPGSLQESELTDLFMDRP